MHNAIKFVERAVAKKQQSVFHINNNKIYSHNDMFTMCAPIALPINCSPKATTFVSIIKAAESAKTIPTFTLTPTGRLSVKAGKLKALVECTTEPMPDMRPEGINQPIDGEDFLHMIGLLEGFMGDDPNHAWANGMLFDGDRLRVTCNTIGISYESRLGFTQPIMIPAAAIKELIKIKLPPISVTYCAKSITFIYGDNHWFKTRTMENKMPCFKKILAVPCNPVALPEDFFDGIKQLKSFIDEEFNIIEFGNVGLTTKTGGEYEIDLPVKYGVYNHSLLMLLENVAQKIDFSSYPKPCIFDGERLRGCIVGLRF